MFRRPVSGAGGLLGGLGSAGTDGPAGRGKRPPPPATPDRPQTIIGNKWIFLRAKTRPIWGGAWGTGYTRTLHLGGTQMPEFPPQCWRRNTVAQWELFTIFYINTVSASVSPCVAWSPRGRGVKEAVVRCTDPGVTHEPPTPPCPGRGPENNGPAHCRCAQTPNNLPALPPLAESLLSQELGSLAPSGGSICPRGPSWGTRCGGLPPDPVVGRGCRLLGEQPQGGCRGPPGAGPGLVKAPGLCGSESPLWGYTGTPRVPSIGVGGCLPSFGVCCPLVADVASAPLSQARGPMGDPSPEPGI